MNRNLTLLGREVTAETMEQSYLDHPERFEGCYQLLCRNHLTDRCYWEVEWSGVVHIAVTYRGIRWDGNRTDCLFGENNQSWSLRTKSGHYSVCHNSEETLLTHFPSSSASGRVAVYVDCPSGILSFYTFFSDTLFHLHTYTTTFTEPLYPGFGLTCSSSVSLCSL